MVDTWLGVGGVPRRLVDPVVGTAAGVRPVQKIWAGSVDGTPVLVFERFVGVGVRVAQTSDKRWDRLVVSWDSLGVGVTYTVLEGTRTVVSGVSGLSVTDQGLLPGKGYVYTVQGWRDGVLVGGGEGSGSTPVLTLSLSVSVVSWSSLKLSWGSVVGLTDWRVLRGSLSGSANHSKVKDESNEAAESWSDTGLSSNTTYYYTLEAIRDKTVVARTTGSHSGKTNVRQQVPQSTGAILASSCGSYRGRGGSPSWGIRERDTRMWVGVGGDAYKDQHSGAYFDIPVAVRSSIAVTKVEVSFRVQYANSTSKAWPLVVMVQPKDGQWPSVWPGSTGRFYFPWARGTDTWLGSHPGEWMDITNLNVPDWGLIKDLVKGGTLVGIGFAPDANSGYGYANFSTAPSIRPRLRVSYTVWES